MDTNLLPRFLFPQQTLRQLHLDFDRVPSESRQLVCSHRGEVTSCQLLLSVSRQHCTMITSHHLQLRRIFVLCCILICATILYTYSKTDTLQQRQSIKPVSVHALYPSNWTLVNLKRFEFLLNSDPCSGSERIELLVLVTSHPGHVDLRGAFRRALPSTALRSFNMRRMFLLGRINTQQTGYRQVDQSIIEEEHLKYGDIVQGDFVESYRNLSYKHIMGLKYATHFCPHAELLLKMDDDIAVDLFRLLQLVRNQSLSSMQIAGAVLTGNELNPVRDKSSKWYVSRDDYAATRYPPFVSGWAYITTIEVARQLVRHADLSPFFWIDDTYITGLLATLSNVTHLDIRPHFTVFTAHLRCCLRNSLSVCDYLVGPSGDDAELIEAFHRHSLRCQRESCQQWDKPSLCVIANDPSASYRGALKEHIVYGQVIPLS